MDTKTNIELEDIITDLNDGKNFRRKIDYDNKKPKPILVCFHGKAYRMEKCRYIIKDLLNLMKSKKGQTKRKQKCDYLVGN